jgi:hypothetical protein
MPIARKMLSFFGSEAANLSTQSLEYLRTREPGEGSSESELVSRAVLLDLGSQLFAGRLHRG